MTYHCMFCNKQKPIKGRIFMNILFRSNFYQCIDCQKNDS